MPTTRYRGPSMTLVSMRHNGVRSLAVRCEVSPGGRSERGSLRRSSGSSMTTGTCRVFRSTASPIRFTLPSLSLQFDSA
jgi:hypothetical protein